MAEISGSWRPIACLKGEAAKVLSTGDQPWRMLARAGVTQEWSNDGSESDTGRGIHGDPCPADGPLDVNQEVAGLIVLINAETSAEALPIGA